jgi:hypothetical protein
MDAKLVLDEKYYYLEVQHERIGKMVVGSSDHELSRIVNQPFKLSTKNCQAIENGYDLDELAILCTKEEATIVGNQKMAQGFIKGFQKALEILGDKKFSIEDIQNVIDSNEDCLVWVNVSEDGGDIKFYLDEDILTESLQPKEWDVEIVMESNLHFGEVVDESYPKDFPLERPKLDANGCIILKRK